MEKLGKVFVGLAFGSLFAVGCSSGELSKGAETDEAAQTAAEVGDSHVGTATADPVAQVTELRVRLEKAQRSLDRGDAKASLADLERLAADTSVTGDDRDSVLLALSRAYELSGDMDAAIEAVETILIANGGREHYEAAEPAEKRLRYLLTGNEEETGLHLPSNGSPPPIATALAELFEAGPSGRVLVDVFAFGRNRANDHGIFEIAEAKRQKLEGELGTSPKVGQSITSSNWLALPRAIGETRDDMPQADRSLLVFYYDLGDNRVPSRYDEYLPMPSDEIAAILERGEGVIVAKKREHGKPVIVIAAPRQAQLEVVEEAFSKMTEVPYKPVTIALKPNLMPGEIQAVVRSSWAGLRGCYESALKRDKTLSGRFSLEFKIDRAGHVRGAKFGDDSTLVEEGLMSCILDGAAKLQFFATGEETTVKYPIVMSP